MQKISENGFASDAAEYLENHRYLLWLLLTAVGLVYIFSSNGFYHIDDGPQYLINREFFFDPNVAFNIWARMGRVILYAPFAYLGFYFAKIAAFIIFMCTIAIAMRIAALLKLKYPSLLILLIGFQPEYFDISYSVLAEVPAVFLLTLSVYFFLVNRKAASLAAISLVFLFRFELSVFTGILFFILLKEKQYKILPAAFIGPVIWWLYTYMLSGSPVLFFENFLTYASFPKCCEGTAWYHYLASTPIVFGIAITIFFFNGIKPIIRHAEKNISRILFGIIGIAYLLFSITTSKYFTVSGAVGDFRYLAQIAPFFGIVALAGLERLLDLHREYRKTAFAPVLPWNVILLVFFLFVQFYIQVSPHSFSKEGQKAVEIINQMHAQKPGSKIYTNRWLVSYISKFVLDYPASNPNVPHDPIQTIDQIDSGYCIWAFEALESEADSLYTKTVSLIQNSLNVTDIETVRFPRHIFPIAKISTVSLQIETEPRKYIVYITFYASGKHI